MSTSQIVAVFEGLCRIVKHVLNPSDCTSAERCILAHLYDLYTSCTLLKTKPHAVETFANAYPKIRLALYAPVQPTPIGNYTYNNQFMLEILTNPRRGMRVEQIWIRQAQESVNNRYSFVTNALTLVCFFC